MNSTSAPPTAPGNRLLQRMRQSPMTAALAIAFIVVYVATVFDADGRIFLAFAKVNDRVREGEVWRLFTASFLHAGVLHLWFNVTALNAVGPGVERTYGSLRYLLLFLFGGAVGMTASVLLVPNPSVGASAGVFAILGAILAYALRYHDRLPPQARSALIKNVLFVVGLNVAIGLLAGFIDNAAHLGGLAGGFVLGLLLRPRRDLFPQAPGRAAPTGHEP